MKTLSLSLLSAFLILVASPTVFAQTTGNGSDVHAKTTSNAEVSPNTSANANMNSGSGVSTHSNISQAPIASSIGVNAVHQDYSSVAGANRPNASNKPWEKQTTTNPQGMTDSTRNYLKNSSSP